MSIWGVLFSALIFSGPIELLGAGPAPAALTAPEPLRFSAVLFPKRTQINFWAYQKEKTLYFPASTLARILRARLHRYDQSSAVILRLAHQKTIGFKAGEQSLTLGGKILTLDSPVLDTPQKDDILIPLSLADRKEFQQYTGIHITQTETLKLAVYPIQVIDSPAIDEKGGTWRAAFYLPRTLKDYEITFLPAENKKNPELVIRFPYAELGKKAAIASALPYQAGFDEKERALIFTFALAENVSMNQIQAKEETLGSRRLILSIPKQPEIAEMKRPVRAAALKQKTPRPAVAAKSAKTPPAKKQAAEKADKKKRPSSPAPTVASLPKIPAAVNGKISTRKAPDAPPPSMSKVKKVILIDAGHGGRDSGAMLPSGAVEKTINLAIALKIAQKLKEKAPDYKVILTRKGDVYVDLSSRAHLTVKQGPMALISIHSNASRAKNKGGYEIYIPANISMDPQAVELVKRENAGKALSPAQAEASLLRRSEKLATAISGNLGRKIGRSMNNRGIRKGDFYILRETRAPAVLIESGFLTHRGDAKLLQNPRFQDKFAEGVADGILSYLKNVN